MSNASHVSSSKSYVLQANTRETSIVAEGNSGRSVIIVRAVRAVRVYVRYVLEVVIVVSAWKVNGRGK